MIGTAITHGEVVASVSQAAAEFGRLERTNRELLTALERLLSLDSSTNRDFERAVIRRRIWWLGPQSSLTA